MAPKLDKNPGNSVYPTWLCQNSELENDPVKIVDFPIENDDFPIFSLDMFNYQRVLWVYMVFFHPLCCKVQMLSSHGFPHRWRLRKAFQPPFKAFGDFPAMELMKPEGIVDSYPSIHDISTIYPRYIHDISTIYIHFISTIYPL